ncbi:hypothetical protein [Methylobacterium terrae]|uniref:hypothetical protein n=1 Tax=Methylobacterium terrae TaxID=2202827 RepID=UPI0013A5980E|nr:hypothetical protein [Methylobacterium terrae]
MPSNGTNSTIGGGGSGWKITAFISALAGFVTAIGTLIVAYVGAQQRFAELLFPEKRVSGLFKELQLQNKKFDQVKFFPTLDDTCRNLQVRWITIRQNASSAIMNKDITKQFDEAENEMERAGRFRMLAQIFINSSDINEARNLAAQKGCLDPN